MPIRVSDRASNKPEHIQNVAKVLGKSKDRLKVFKAIYHHKRKIKTVSELVNLTHIERIRVLQEANRLAGEEIVTKTKLNGELAYERDSFIAINKMKILSIVGNKKKIDAIPTKRSANSIVSVKVAISSESRSLAKRISIDDISSFAATKDVFPKDENCPVDEKLIKEFFRLLLAQYGTYKDWGGEISDLFTTHLKVRQKREAAAFAFKGKATKGSLTPAKMGKNGDQIQRLFTAPADVFFVVYWGNVSESVQTEMIAFAVLRARMMKSPVKYCIIDGQDLLRLFEAYPDKLAKAKKNLAKKK